MKRTGLNSFKIALLERAEPTTIDLAIHFRFLCAVKAKLPMRARYNAIDIIFQVNDALTVYNIF